MAQLTTPRIKQTGLDLRKTEVEAEGEEEEDRQSSLREGAANGEDISSLWERGAAIVASKHELAPPTNSLAQHICTVAAGLPLCHAAEEWALPLKRTGLRIYTSCISAHTQPITNIDPQRTQKTQGKTL